MTMGKMEDEIMRKCMKFEMCSVNRCPLSMEYENLRPAQDDPEKVCKLRKKKRVLLAKGTKIKYGGLTGKEKGGEKSQEMINSEEGE